MPSKVAPGALQRSCLSGTIRGFSAASLGSKAAAFTDMERFTTDTERPTLLTPNGSGTISRLPDLAFGCANIRGLCKQGS